MIPRMGKELVGILIIEFLSYHLVVICVFVACTLLEKGSSNKT